MVHTELTFYNIFRYLFEGAMYIFVLQWPPSMIAVVANGAVPFGTVFSVFETM